MYLLLDWLPVKAIEPSLPECLWFIFRVFLLLDRLSFMTYILCPNVLVTHSWGWIGECQSLSIRRWVMHTAPLGLQLLRDPPQSGLGLQRPSYRGVPSCVQGALRESCLWRGYVPEGWDLHASAHFFTMAGYPAAIAESEMYISQLLFTIALDTSHKPVARGHHNIYINSSKYSLKLFPAVQINCI